MIRLDVSVTDKSGNPVSGLGRHDFTLRDNGQPEKIVSFQAFGFTAKPDPPVEVILVIDELNMPYVPRHGTAESLTPEQEAESFLRQNQGHLSQPVSVYRITNDRVTASTQGSFDGNALAEEIASRRQPHVIWKMPMISESLGQAVAGGNIAWRITHSLTALGSIAIQERLKPGRKLMFWLGPGWQIDRRRGTGLYDFFSELSTRLREARIELWSATEWPLDDGYGNPVPVSEFSSPDLLKGVKPEMDDFGYLALQAVATQTGGGILATSRDLADLIGKRVEEASTFYSLTFDPSRTNVEDEYHDLKVEAGNPDFTTHTRTGYFDQPVFYDQPPGVTQRVNVEQLEHTLASIGNSSDGDLARQLYAIELTERLNSVKLATLEARLKGEKARQALVALADESVFLPPPAGEIPSAAPPDMATQRQMLGQTVDYVNKTISKLPNFFAGRTMVEYHQLPMKPGQTWKTATGDESLHLDQMFKATLLFRDGKEVVREQVTEGKPLVPGEPTLTTVGTFGPLLATVVAGATSAGSDLSWSRWEQGTNVLQAVFRYRVPQETPLFSVGFGYLANDGNMVHIEKKARFHGELAVDPATGAILRLTVQADLEPRLPLARSDVMVEYSPVIIGGNTYICPTRSVTISRQRSVTDIHEWGATFTVYAPFKTILTDMAYDNYHEFRPTSRMLPGFTPLPGDR